MKVLLISSSARGHAIADALVRSPEKPEIINICPSRNPGIRKIAAEQYVQDIMDFEKILEIAKKTKPEFAFIGPDDPIGGGLADELEKIGIPSVAPRKTLARLESSKGFTRDLMKKYAIDASPKYNVFTEKDAKGIETFIDQLEEQYVVKYDGLKGGKGVKVSGDHLASKQEGIDYALECIEEGGRVVIEEKLIGVEFSLLGFTSGSTVVNMPAVQDHKRAYEGDTGPNTGGMGTYTDSNHSLPFLSQKDLEAAATINRQIAEALQKECGEPYKGILYGGFISVKDGVRVIEYNARFGDPEALNLLPLLKSDLVTLCRSIIDGSLTEGLATFSRLATVCKYITPKSYPEKKDERGQEVIFPTNIPDNARIFYGDIAESDDGKLSLGGSRTAGIVGIGKTIAEAETIAEKLCNEVQGPVRHRSDIGTKALIEQRIEAMNELRA